MVRKFAMAAASAAALTAVGATAAAQVLVEVEGPIENFRGYGPGTDRVLTVMGIPVIITGQTLLYSPTADRRGADDPVGEATGNGRYNLGQWYNGLNFPGRSDRGFIGGTAIVLGTFDPDYVVLDRDGLAVFDEPGAIIPDEVFSEPAENVVLGLITDSQCSGDNCDAALLDTDGITVTAYLDWLRGNSGVYMVPVFDPRMPAGPLVDELGFALDLDEGDSLTGREFGVEGYYGDVGTPIDLDNSGDIAGDGSEHVQALHYFHLELVGADATLLANSAAEVAAVRVQCRAGDELEVRGGVHSAVDPVTGDALDAGAVSPTRLIRVLDENDNIISQGVPADIAALGAPDGTVIPNDPFGEFRLRDRTIGVCPTTITVQWVDLIDGELARQEGVAVDLL